jgi:hypothetical protein
MKGVDEFWETVTGAMEEYRATGWPTLPSAFLAADWQIAACLLDLKAHGRPGTREELDQYASGMFGHPVKIVAYGEETT